MQRDDRSKRPLKNSNAYYSYQLPILIKPIQTCHSIIAILSVLLLITGQTSAAETFQFIKHDKRSLENDQMVNSHKLSHLNPYDRTITVADNEQQELLSIHNLFPKTAHNNHQQQSFSNHYIHQNHQSSLDTIKSNINQSSSLASVNDAFLSHSSSPFPLLNITAESESIPFSHFGKPPPSDFPQQQHRSKRNNHYQDYNHHQLFQSKTRQLPKSISLPEGRLAKTVTVNDDEAVFINKGIIILADMSKIDRNRRYVDELGTIMKSRTENEESAAPPARSMISKDELNHRQSAAAEPRSSLEKENRKHRNRNRPKKVGKEMVAEESAKNEHKGNYGGLGGFPVAILLGALGAAVCAVGLIGIPIYLLVKRRNRTGIVSAASTGAGSGLGSSATGGQTDKSNYIFGIGEGSVDEKRRPLFRRLSERRLSHSSSSITTKGTFIKLPPSSQQNSQQVPAAPPSFSTPTAADKKMAASLLPEKSTKKSLLEQTKKTAEYSTAQLHKPRSRAHSGVGGRIEEGEEASTEYENEEMIGKSQAIIDMASKIRKITQGVPELDIEWIDSEKSNRKEYVTANRNDVKGGNQRKSKVDQAKSKKTDYVPVGARLEDKTQLLTDERDNDKD